MKHLSLVAVVSLCLALCLVSVPAFAQKTTGNGTTSGAHYQFNIIGSPKGISGDDSNGRSIMVPLKNATGPSSIVCEADQYVLANDTVPTYSAQVPTGARIYFEPSNTFEIVDWDATDGVARIKVPVTGDQITFDIYLRVLGKPNTCMDIDAYAWDADQSACTSGRAAWMSTGRPARARS